MYLSNAPAFQPVSPADILPVESPIFSNPFSRVPIAYALKQKFMCQQDYFGLLPLNTPHFDFPDFLLCAESDREPDGDCVRWERTYCKVPQPGDLPGTYSNASTAYSLPGQTVYKFIDYATGGSDPTIQKGRIGKSKTVDTRTEYAYFLLDPSGPYITEFDVPIISEQKYYLNQVFFVPNTETTELVSTTQSLFPTDPTREEYEGWIAAKTPIVSQSSSVQIWMGNIVQRATIYILPQ